MLVRRGLLTCINPQKYGQSVRLRLPSQPQHDPRTGPIAHTGETLLGSVATPEPSWRHQALGALLGAELTTLGGPQEEFYAAVPSVRIF